MSMDADSLATLIVSNYKREMREAFPSVVKSVNIEQVPKEDGTLEYQIENVTGPAEVDEARFRPLAKAIAAAIVSHLNSSAEADDTDPTNGGKWRIL